MKKHFGLRHSIKGFALLNFKLITISLLSLTMPGLTAAEPTTSPDEQEWDGVADEENSEDENPSDPTASVKYTDIRYRYLDLDHGAERNLGTVEGALMLNPNFKFTYELHYTDTDISGSDESSFESVHAKGIYLGKNRRLNQKVGYKFAAGAELIANLGDYSDGTGSGAHQIAPLAAIAWALPANSTVITLAQHYRSVDEDSDAPDVDLTALRLIWLKQLEGRMWLKLDNKFLINHEHSDKTSNTFELQLGKMLNPGFGIYTDALYQTGGFDQYDWGLGIGLRFMY